ncbi:MAG: EutN/CcmL family microcompartment protein [bacterium]
MYIGRVIGDIVSTIKFETLKGHKLLLVQPLTPEMNEDGEPIIALDMVDAGIGDIVLIVDQGTAARTVLSMEYPTVRTLILGIVDRIQIEKERGE